MAAAQGVRERCCWPGFIKRMSDVKGRTNVFELELRDEAPDGSLSPTPTHQRITGSGAGGTANSALAKANAAMIASRANR